MTNEQAKIIAQLRSEGYAVAIFTPEELNGADVDWVEDKMVEQGWFTIETMGDELT